jgi:hypothetical protein
VRGWPGSLRRGVYMAPSASFERSNALTRGLPHFPSTRRRRPAIVLISLVVVLFAVISGAAPAMASSMVHGSQGMPVLALKPAQPGSLTLTATPVSSSEIDLSWTVSSDVSPPPSGGSPPPSGGSPPPSGGSPPPSGGSPPPSGGSPPPSGGSPPPSGGSPPPSGGSQLGLSDGSQPVLSDVSQPASYNLYEGRSSGGESQTPVNRTPVKGTTFRVTGLTSSTTYYFVVLAADGSRSSSDEEQATTFSPDGSSSGSSPGDDSTPWWWWALAILIPVIIGGLIVWWRSRRKATTPQPASGHSVQAVTHAGQPGPVTINATGTGATLTVRIQRHPSPGVTTTEEVPPP